MARPKTLSDGQRKTARVSLLMTPRLFDDITTLARIKKISVNDLFCLLAEQTVKKNRVAIDTVQKILNDVSSTVDLTIDDISKAPE